MSSVKKKSKNNSTFPVPTGPGRPLMGSLTFGSKIWRTMSLTLLPANGHPLLLDPKHESKQSASKHEGKLIPISKQSEVGTSKLRYCWMPSLQVWKLMHNILHYLLVIPSWAECGTLGCQPVWTFLWPPAIHSQVLTVQLTGNSHLLCADWYRILHTHAPSPWLLIQMPPSQ